MEAKQSSCLSGSLSGCCSCFLVRRSACLVLDGFLEDTRSYGGANSWVISLCSAKVGPHIIYQTGHLPPRYAPKIMSWPFWSLFWSTTSPPSTELQLTVNKSMVRWCSKRGGSGVVQQPPMFVLTQVSPCQCWAERSWVAKARKAGRGERSPRLLDALGRFGMFQGCT